MAGGCNFIHLTCLPRGTRQGRVRFTRLPEESIGAAERGGGAGGGERTSDGRYIAFHSDASNLVAGDTNAADDIFVYDRSTASLRRISVGANGLQANAGSYRSSLSGTGSTLTFSSDASNLAPGDANGRTDVFVVLTQSRNR